ncbi:MAG: hypothetical protein QF510_03330, partial [Rhodospirillales bacterium]|nr:hypothetical protein [Rhodospirillales bacterium]
DSQGGFGTNLWKGSQLVFIKRLLAEHPERVRSHVMRGLLRRVLLSAATPPKGAEGTAFTAARLEALMAMGEYKAGLALLEAIPRKNREAAFLAPEVELHLVTGKVVKACGTVATEVTRRKEVFWQKAMIYCQILASETSKAEFGLALLQENETTDPTFLTLAESMINGEPKLPEEFNNISLLHLAMLQTAKLALPMVTARQYPAALITITRDPTAANRLDALEIAAEEGLLTGVTLRKRYMAALPAAGSAADVDARAKVLGSLGRAWLYGEAARSNIPVAKAEALGRIMVSASEAGRLGGVARLFAPIVNTLTPENDLLWVAPAAFRMQVLTGQQELASAWFALARRNAAISSDANVIYQSLIPLGAMMQVGHEANRKPPPLDDLSADQKILYLSLFHQLGGDVSLELLETLIYRSERPTPLPDPVLWLRMTRLNDQKVIPRAHASSEPISVKRTAAPGVKPVQKVVGPMAAAQTLAPPSGGGSTDELPRLGERILMMLVIMGDQSLGDLNPIIISEIVHGLKQAGLVAEARNLAMEVAVNAGL